MSSKDPKGGREGGVDPVDRPEREDKLPALPEVNRDDFDRFQREMATSLERVQRTIESANRLLREELEIRHLRSLAEVESAISRIPEAVYENQRRLLQLDEGDFAGRLTDFRMGALEQKIEDARIVAEKRLQDFKEKDRREYDELVAMVGVGTVIGLLSPTIIDSFLSASTTDAGLIYTSISTAILGGLAAAMLVSFLHQSDQKDTSVDG